METLLLDILDKNLRFTLAFGIGLHHAGLHERDRKTVEELFVNQKIQVDIRIIRNMQHESFNSEACLYESL